MPACSPAAGRPGHRLGRAGHSGSSRLSPVAEGHAAGPFAPLRLQARTCFLSILTDPGAQVMAVSLFFLWRRSGRRAFRLSPVTR